VQWWGGRELKEKLRKIKPSECGLLKIGPSLTTVKSASSNGGAGRNVLRQNKVISHNLEEVATSTS